jgi:site-specific DNA recombinase
MKVAIYCRVSTDEQNVQQQRDLLVKYCNEKDYKFRSYMDSGVSGSISDRLQWQQLLKDLENKEFDILLVTKVDRITRSLKYAVWFYEWLQANTHIKFISLYDSIDLTTPDGYFNFMLQCLLSERELQINKWRSRIGIERAKLEGKYKGGTKGRTWTN